MAILVGMGHLAPCQDEDAIKQVRARSDKLNAEILRRSVFSRDIAYLAAPVIGGAVSVNRIQQLFLLAKTRKHSDPATFVWDIFKENGERMLKEGKVIDSEEENLQELKASYSSFHEKAIPLLKAMGVVN